MKTWPDKNKSIHPPNTIKTNRNNRQSPNVTSPITKRQTAFASYKKINKNRKGSTVNKSRPRYLSTCEPASEPPLNTHRRASNMSRPRPYYIPIKPYWFYFYIGNVPRANHADPGKKGRPKIIRNFGDALKRARLSRWEKVTKTRNTAVGARSILLPYKCIGKYRMIAKRTAEIRWYSLAFIDLTQLLSVCAVNNL